MRENYSTGFGFPVAFITSLPLEVALLLLDQGSLKRFVAYRIFYDPRSSAVDLYMISVQRSRSATEAVHDSTCQHLIAAFLDS